MALPRGWAETLNEWRRRLRDPARFSRIRSKPLEGIRGVYMVGGPLKRTDREAKRHSAGAWVTQALRFKRADWPSLTEAVGWYEASRFPDEAENPPKRHPNPRPRENPHSGKLMWSEAPRTLGDLARTRVFYEGGRFLESAIMSDLSQEDRDRIEDYLVRIGHPLASEPGTQVQRIAAAARELATFPGGKIPPVPGVYRSGRRQNPQVKHRTAEERASAASMAAVVRLVERQGELSAAIATVRAKLERGEIPEPSEHNRMTDAKEAVGRATAELDRAVRAHGAVVEEFHVQPASRRENPPRGTRAAADLYREFHGREPKGFTVRKIPDLEKLVHLGKALEVHYRPAVPRGPRNTPYRHTFRAGAELLAPPGGGALVILGKFNVSRAPRGKFGYIRG